MLLRESDRWGTRVSDAEGGSALFGGTPFLVFDNAFDFVTEPYPGGYDPFQAADDVVYVGPR